MLSEIHHPCHPPIVDSPIELTHRSGTRNSADCLWLAWTLRGLSTRRRVDQRNTRDLQSFITEPGEASGQPSSQPPPAFSPDGLIRFVTWSGDCLLDPPCGTWSSDSRSISLDFARRPRGAPYVGRGVCQRLRKWTNRHESLDL
jgi:hypothetical protein